MATAAMTLMRLEAEQRRTQHRGVRPSRRFGPAPAFGADGTRLERFVFRVAAVAPASDNEFCPWEDSNDSRRCGP